MMEPNKKSLRNEWRDTKRADSHTGEGLPRPF